MAEERAQRRLAAILVALHQRRFDLAGIHFNRAVRLNPNDVYIAADRANWLVRIGRLAEALQSLEAAVQRDPFRQHGSGSSASMRSFI
ncbi:MAG: hypothetical protein ACT4SY_10175 [Hyphomicrobiales bacterium]